MLFPRLYFFLLADMWAHIISSYHPVGTQLVVDTEADQAGGSSFVLSRAGTVRSLARWLCPAHYLTVSIATVGPIGALIAAVCSQFTESHGSRKEAEEIVPGRITRANKSERKIATFTAAHLSNSPVHFLYHTGLLLIWATHRSPLTYLTRVI